MKEMEEIITTLKEIREGCAACFRVIADGGLDRQLEIELRRSGIKFGFGTRCQDLISKLEVRVK